MLTERYSLEFLRSHLLSPGRWRPFPPAADRGAWDALWDDPLNRERRAHVVGGAEALVGTPWPALPATLYMGYVRTDGRNEFESLYNLRRSRLARLVLAECMEYRGRFLDEIINGVWLITEEAGWAIPAHARRDQLGDDVDPLPKQDEDTPELSSLRTLAQLDETSYLLAEALDAVSPTVRDRIRRQSLARMMEPFENHDEDYYGWMDGHNNWTPYCCSQLLLGSMYVVDDLDRLARLAYKMMGAVDRFTVRYGPDGGCDEGPGYWGMAAGAMFRFLELLHARTEGAVTIYDEPLIREMGLYITRVHLAGHWFANFADASARIRVARELIYSYGQRVGSERMQTFAAVAGNWAPPEQPYAVSVERLFHPVEIPRLPLSAWRPEPASWMPDIQVLVTRDGPETGEGLVCAAKAGSNNESHNHNDIGQFILVLDGEPVIIDIGSERYTRKTFGPGRYGFWTLRASGHNVPMVNGFEQSPGRYAERDAARLAELKATDVSYAADGARHGLGMSLQHAYPPEAGIVSLRRELVHDTGQASSVSVTDAVELKAGPAEIVVPLHTPHPPDCSAPGIVQLGAGGRKLRLSYDGDTVTPKIEAVAISDAGLRSIWGPVLHRIEMCCRSSGPRVRMTLKFATDA